MIRSKVCICMIVVLIFTCLSGCSASTSKDEASEETLSSERSSDAEDNDEETENAEDSLQPLFTSENQPVACWENYFIMRNLAGTQYGLSDNTGKEILPCQYGNVDFIQAGDQMLAKVQDKGLYGLFALDGTCLIECNYTELNCSSYTDLCVCVDFSEKCALLNTDGEIVLPCEYDEMRLVYGKNVVAAKNDPDTQTSEIQIFDEKGNLMSSVPWNKEKITGLSLIEGGKYILISYDSTHIERYDLLSMSGQFTDRSGYEVEYDITVGDWIVYGTFGGVTVENADTGEKKEVWRSQDEKYVMVTNSRAYKDPVSESQHIILNGASGRNNYTIHLTIGDDLQAFDEGSMSNPGSVSGFYNDVAFVVPEKGYVYTIDSNGDKMMDIERPYTSYIFLDGIIALNNQGYWSFYDVEGNEVLTDIEVSDVDYDSLSGISAIQDNTGALGLINSFADILVPCGSVTSQESAVIDLSDYNDEYEAYYLKGASEGYGFIEGFDIVNNDTDMTWALFNESNSKLVTDFMGTDEKASLYYQSLVGQNGYTLISEDASKLFIVAIEDGAFEVYDFVSLLP